MPPLLYYPNLSSTWPRTNAAQIVTRVENFKGFYLAEAYHQNFLALHSDDP
ncbi:peptide-methionine (S)-S-oxide reductase [Paraburkholderia madseniana]|uniref:peptide-methionine (S)-S-oxide reductase n=1 Tax=Paraburkholderia madseniana TaxID=2599607 RepID=UPI003558BF49